MSGYGNSTTPRGADDGRRKQTGHRVMIAADDYERLHLAQMVARRLSAERVHQLRLLADAFALEDAMQPVEKGGA